MKMIPSPEFRRTLGIAAVGLVIATWTGVAAVVFLLPFDKVRFVIMWTVAVAMTDALFWLAVAVGGITALNRFRIWRGKARSSTNEGD